MQVRPELHCYRVMENTSSPSRRKRDDSDVPHSQAIINVRGFEMAYGALGRRRRSLAQSDYSEAKHAQFEGF